MKNNRRREAQYAKKERQQFETALRKVDNTAILGIIFSTAVTACVFYLFKQPVAVGGIAGFIASGAAFVGIGTILCQC